MNNYIKFFRLLFITLICTATSPSTVQKKVTVEMLVSASDCIIAGVVEKVECKMSRMTGLPMTLTTVKVTNSLKGSDTKTVTVQTPGGTINGRTRFILGVPIFSEGEEVVLFLKKKKSNSHLSHYYGVTGWSQGKYTITTDMNTSQKYAYIEETDAPNQHRLSGKHPSSVNINGGIPLNELLTKISHSILLEKESK